MWGGWGSNPRPRDYEWNLGRKPRSDWTGLSVFWVQKWGWARSREVLSGGEWHKNGTILCVLQLKDGLHIMRQRQQK